MAALFAVFRTFVLLVLNTIYFVRHGILLLGRFRKAIKIEAVFLQYELIGLFVPSK